jgi:hypothetical protein
LDKTTSKKLSRRDAIKVLGAATGAVVLANLPTKWSKPELISGVLPAHAQTSTSLPFAMAGCGVAGTLCADTNSLVTITPAASGIPMRYLVIPSNPGGTIINPAALTGVIPTDGSGVADLYLQINFSTFNIGDTFTINWSFENSSDGTGTCQQVHTYDGQC